MTKYDYLKMKWEKREEVEKARKSFPVFSKNETLAQVNEKARLHDMTYGQYVQARENGKFAEDYGTIVKMNHSPRTAFCKSRKYNARSIS